MGRSCYHPRLLMYMCSERPPNLGPGLGSMGLMAQSMEQGTLSTPYHPLVSLVVSRKGFTSAYTIDLLLLLVKIHLLSHLEDGLYKQINSFITEQIPQCAALSHSICVLERPSHFGLWVLQWKGGVLTQSCGMLVPAPWFPYLLLIVGLSTFPRVTRNR